MLRVKYVSTITNNNPAHNNTAMYDIPRGTTVNPFIENISPPSNYKTMTNFKTQHFEKREDLGQSRASVGSRKSFNADDYLQSLKYKLKDSEHNYVKNDFLAQEREYLKTSYEEVVKKEYEKNKPSQTHLNNFSMNLYEKETKMKEKKSLSPDIKNNSIGLSVIKPVDGGNIKKPGKVSNIIKGDLDNFEEIERIDETKIAPIKNEDEFDF
jgi:hypothetical protein